VNHLWELCMAARSFRLLHGSGSAKIHSHLDEFLTAAGTPVNAVTRT
jgi:hypothetical protein